MNNILVTGACGQLGSELTLALRDRFGRDQVIASDLREPEGDLALGPFELLNVLDTAELHRITESYHVGQIYHLAAILSARGEQSPQQTWQINMEGLLNVLETTRVKKLEKVYWPSSIAVFGPTTPKTNTPQHTLSEPNTVYGISKLAGERWCEYYFEKFRVDVRSLRYPGLIGYKSLPGGGTTDYAVDIFYKAIEGKTFQCFLAENTYLPMMYMEDAVKATIELMQAPAERIRIRSSYNISAMSFSPRELAQEVKKHIPGFSIEYRPDYRQTIAESWPQSIDDSKAQEDWRWTPSYNLEEMTSEILEKLPILLD